MNELKIFEGQNIEVVNLNGEALFNAKDVAKILDIKNVRDNLRTMTDKQCILLKNSAVGDADIRKLNNAGENFLTEAGVYKLAFRSNKPNAERFTDWVTSEVLPSIRKYGMYATDELLDNPDFLIEVLQELKTEREEKKKLQLENEIKNQQINELKPKADYTDLILKSKNLITITQIAKDYGMSGKRMNEILHDLKIQYKQSGQWLLYSEHQNKGYTHSETIKISKTDGTNGIRMNTKWTQKGRLFLYELLKSKDIYPTIELN